MPTVGSTPDASEAMSSFAWTDPEDSIDKTQSKSSKRIQRVRAVAIHQEVAPTGVGVRAPPREEGRADAVDAMREWAEEVTAHFANPR